MEPSKVTSVNSRAEELFVQLFCEAFGPKKTENLQVQYPCVDIYGRHRYIDFALESPESKIAIEIDGETYHNPSKVSENKYTDDLLKQNSLVYDNWKVYRWIYSQLEKQPEKIKEADYILVHHQNSRYENAAQEMDGLLGIHQTWLSQTSAFSFNQTKFFKLPQQLRRFVVCATQCPLDILDREDDEHPVLLVQPAVFHGQAHAIQQDAVERLGIRGQALEPWLLKKSLGNAVERKQFSGLSVKVVKGHVAFSTFCSSLCSKNQPPFV